MIKSAKCYQWMYILILFLSVFTLSLKATAQGIGGTTLTVTNIRSSNGTVYATLNWTAATNADHYIFVVNENHQGFLFYGRTTATSKDVSFAGDTSVGLYIQPTDYAEYNFGSPSNTINLYPGRVPTPATNNADPNDGPCPGCGATQNGPSAGEPVNLATGTEIYEPSPDLTVYNPSGLPVSFARNYRSDRALASQFSPGLSPGWGHSYDVSAQGPSAAGTWGALTLTYQNGAQEALTPTLSGSGVPTGAFAVPAGSSYFVTGTPSSTIGQWQSLTITWKDRTQWKLTPGAGVYVLNQITNRVGQSLALNWNSNRQLTSIADAIRSTVLLSLSYDGNGNLSTLTDFYGRKIVYAFSIPSGLSNYCLLSASQITASTTANPPARWTYNYNTFFGEPLLSSITVPSPTGTGTGNAVCQINYDTTST